MRTFNEYLTEGKLKWKMNKKVSPANEKLIDLQAWIPELEYVSGDYVIVKLGTSRSNKEFMMIDNGKVVQNSRNNMRTYSKLTSAKTYFEEM